MSEALEIAGVILGALGGGALIMAAFANWLGSLWAKRLVQNHKKDLDTELESHKVRLRKSEFIFEREYEAASEFVALYRGLLPRYSHPEMGYYEACDSLAMDFASIEQKLDSYLAKHGAILSEESIDRLSRATSIAGNGKFELGGTPEVPSGANKLAAELWGLLKAVEGTLRERVVSQAAT